MYPTYSSHVCIIYIRVLLIYIRLASTILKVWNHLHKMDPITHLHTTHTQNCLSRLWEGCTNLVHTMGIFSYVYSPYQNHLFFPSFQQLNPLIKLFHCLFKDSKLLRLVDSFQSAQRYRFLMPWLFLPLYLIEGLYIDE